MNLYQTCSFSLEWPPLASLVAKSQEPRGCLKRLSDTVRNIFNIANVTNPQDEGVIDHMVSITTAMRSPFIAVACHTVSYHNVKSCLMFITHVGEHHTVLICRKKVNSISVRLSNIWKSCLSANSGPFWSACLEKANKFFSVINPDKVKQCFMIRKDFKVKQVFKFAVLCIIPGAISTHSAHLELSGLIFLSSYGHIPSCSNQLARTWNATEQ